ncbi:ATP-binding protein [Methanoculleus chikugoensis]|uniref:sensor histidine kinase n=1 Tax=Methanoculleus chikugoensis TaxID=118126 RepID=UPI001FB551E0|nr:ATP-binding protein [Methanoculleus chikugoensis]
MTVLVDGLLSEVVTNLIGNAVKHGGPDVEIEILVEDAEEGTVQVTVADTGPGGIPKEIREAVFARFGQESSQGLGLSIVRMLVERYGGRVWVEDRVPGHPEEGAAFRFTLRQADGGESPAPDT